MQSLNDFDKEKFISIFGNVFENSIWIAEETYKFTPFNSFEDLEQKMINIFESSGKKNILTILTNHPDLANKVKISSLSNESKKEQKNSNLDNCTEDEFNEFNKLNISYKKKFGFPFILAVSGKNKNEILNCFKKRIMLQSEIEFKEAIYQVKKIASVRLNNIKKFINNNRI